tara:strand:- start:371 stop:1093 length:723 start_codon:yes stop_codon:yes gene_type:complete
MHKYIFYIKVLVMIVIVVFLYVFSSIKSDSKLITGVSINFTGSNNLFISKEKVDNLLIQNNEYIGCVSKDVLDLKALELKISSNEMIEKSEAYINIDGELVIDVKQRKPYARVISNSSYYIDSNAKKMPLSFDHSARVLLVYGLTNESKIDKVFKLIKAIWDDEFLSFYVTDILVDIDNQISLQIRNSDFEILVGDLNNLDQKMKNFKAFYQKAYKDGILKNYKKVNLQYNNQVICTKNI